MRKFLLIIIPILIYLGSWYFVYAIGVNKLLIQTEDSVPALFTPVTIIKEGSPYLDSYYKMMILRYPHPDDKKQVIGLTPFYLKRIGSHYISAFTLLPALLVLPIFLFPVLFGISITWFNLALLGKIASGLAVSLAGYILFKAGGKILSRKKALLLWSVFLFGTINFASISQALWQHGFVELFTSLGILLLLKEKKEPPHFFWIGILFGAAALCRPTAGVSIAIWGIYTLLQKDYKKVLSYILGILICALFFYAYNSIYFVDVSNQGYYSQAFDSWRTPIYLGLPGMLFSPSKGIFTYSPALLFSLIGFWLVVKSKKYKSDSNERVFFFSFIVIVVHLIILSMWKHWYGGWSFGYRMAADVIPYFSILLIPYLNSALFDRTKRIFLFLLAWSVCVQLMGIAFFDGIWHAAYDRGYKNQSWLWSLENSEIVFNIKRSLVKAGLIKPFI